MGFTTLHAGTTTFYCLFVLSRRMSWRFTFKISIKQADSKGVQTSPLYVLKADYQHFLEPLMPNNTILQPNNYVQQLPCGFPFLFSIVRCAFASRSSSTSSLISLSLPQKQLVVSAGVNTLVFRGLLCLNEWSKNEKNVYFLP
jgi:hypothetical protein